MFQLTKKNLPIFQIYILQFALNRLKSLQILSKCGRGDLNPHPLLRGLGPQPSASANSATSAQNKVF